MSLLSHKRERSLGLPTSIPSGSSDSLSPISSSESSEDNTGLDSNGDGDGSDEEWSESAEQPHQRRGAPGGGGGFRGAQPARRRRALPSGLRQESTESLRNLQMSQQQFQQQQGTASRPRRSAPPDHRDLQSGSSTPKNSSFDPSSGSASLGFPTSTSEPFLPSHLDAQDAAYPQRSSPGQQFSRGGTTNGNGAGAEGGGGGGGGERMTRSTTHASHFSRPHHPRHLNLGQQSTLSSAPFNLQSALQPPSLSPMTISTPTFFQAQSSNGTGGYDFGAEGGRATTPITPVSPFSMGHASYNSSQQTDYTNSYASQAQLQFLSTSSSSFNLSSAAYPTEGEPQRSKLKRSHSHRDSSHSNSLPFPSPSFPSYPSSATTSSFPHSSSPPGPPPIVPENGAFLHRQHEPFGEPFVGPQTELEAAATMAAMAAAKTGAGAGAFVYKVYQ
ncbi:hypothetical protein P7C70_g8521, partial [Phenoliferia sp. Uapishka_3]